MKRVILSIFLFFTLLPSSHAGDFKPFDGPLPIVVMFETIPFESGSGPFAPSFVLYEDGQVIYQQRKIDKDPIYMWKDPTYMWKKLTQRELLELKIKFKSFGDFRKFEKYVHRTQTSDSPFTQMYLNIDGTRLVASIEGLSRSNYVSQTEMGIPDFLPIEIRNLHSFITQLTFSDAEEWVPIYIEATMTNGSYAKGKSIHWPKKWPGLNSKTSIRTGDSYSIFLPGYEMKNVSKFLATEAENGAVEIGGRKWVVWVQYVFPSQPILLEVFQR